MSARSRLSLLATLFAIAPVVPPTMAAVRVMSLAGSSGPRSGTLLKLLAADSCHVISCHEDEERWV